MESVVDLLYKSGSYFVSFLFSVFLISSSVFFNWILSDELSFLTFFSTFNVGNKMRLVAEVDPLSKLRSNNDPFTITQLFKKQETHSLENAFNLLSSNNFSLIFPNQKKKKIKKCSNPKYKSPVVGVKIIRK